MNFAVQITDQADFDIRAIYEYIAYDLMAPVNAAGQLIRLEQAITSLAYMPERHRRYEREPWLSKGLRVFPVDNYLVFYAIDYETQHVNILRVMFSSRNVDKELETYYTHTE